ncbi:hypothetical protein BKA62DRAFT_826103 [Auriculariales sp. MPI-PUGE-AT-0066]|nr:hypothetical protein BKA62DRAFT_826103 [Auriculariales sp. MPI-PUGE-AT-0066]
MAHKLADELLKDILSPPLLVPDDMFANRDAVSPFSKVDRSAADVLLVCKRWMRVGTPALYHTVVLRSMAQARALASALRRCPDFGTYIRRLRVEGSYGEYIWQAVKTAPHITELCLSLTVYSDVKVDGMVKSIAMLNPTRVILTVSPEKKIKNKNQDALIAALCKGITKWSRMHTFEFSGSHTAIKRWDRRPDYLLFPELLEALSSSLSVEVVRLGVCLDSSTIAIADSAGSAMTKLLTSRHSVRLVFSKANAHGAWEHMRFTGRIPQAFQSRISMDANVASSNPNNLLVAPTTSVQHQFLPNPFFKPFQAMDDATRESILACVAEHALRRDHPLSYDLLDKWYDLAVYDSAAAESWLQVNTEWKMAALRVLARRIVVHDDAVWAGLNALLASHPNLLRYTTSLRLSPHWSTITPAVQSKMLSFTAKLVDARVTPTKAVFDMLRSTGSSATLQSLELVLNSSCDGFSLIHLSGFPALESLYLGIFSFADKTSAASELPLVDLPRLRSLTISRCPPFVLKAFIESHRLPAWTALDASSYHDVTFLPSIQSRAQLVRTVKLWRMQAEDWATLPAMEVLDLCENFGDTVPLYLSQPEAAHSNLRVLRFHSSRNAYNRSYKLAIEQAWTRVLSICITREKFPKLETIQMMSEEALWPTNEREIQKSIWPKLAVDLQKQGFTLLDRDGRVWRPRLR